MNLNNYSKLDIEKDDLIDDVLYNDSNIIAIKFFQSEEELIDGWDDTQSLVAGEIQSNLDCLGLDEKFAWNIYIIFIINFKLDKSFKSKFESNTFCCKKYIIKVDDLENEEEINNEIENTIALFSKFDFNEGSSSSSNRGKIKEKIFENSNKSILMKNFRDTPNVYNIIDNDSISKFINKLKSEYINEN